MINNNKIRSHMPIYNFHVQAINSLLNNIVTIAYVSFTMVITYK